MSRTPFLFCSPSAFAGWPDGLPRSSRSQNTAYSFPFLYYDKEDDSIVSQERTFVNPLEPRKNAHPLLYL